MLLHIIYTESGVHLSKESYSSWREIQEVFSDYKASLGPWDVDEVVEFLGQEYAKLSPPASVQIAEFLQSVLQRRELTFLP